MKKQLLLTTLFFLSQINLFGQKNDTLPYHEDAPHVFYENNKIVVRQITKKGLSTTTYSPNENVVLTIKDPTDSLKTFKVKLRKEHKIPEYENILPEKVFITSDIEGEFPAFKKLLIDGGVINENFEWIYGTGHLYLNGDMVDRGKFVTEDLWLAYKLEQEAELAGGKVIFILGNHDIMLLLNDNRYVNQKYVDNAKFMNLNLSDFYSENTEFGRWFRKKNTIQRMGKYTLVHAGVSPEVANLNLSYGAMNDYVRKKINKEFCNEDCKKITGKSTVGLYWFRGMGKQLLTQEQVNLISKQLKTDRIIIGHTVYPEITPLYDGKVIAMDMNHHKNIKTNKVEALVIENGCFKQFISTSNVKEKKDLFEKCN